MKKLINKHALLKLKKRIIIKTIIICRFTKRKYQQLSKKKRLLLFTATALFILLMISILAAGNNSSQTDKTKQQTNFEAKSKKTQIENKTNLTNANNDAESINLQSQIQQANLQASHQYDSINAQLNKIQDNMNALASQNDFQQLQQTISKPNQTMLGKVDGLQSSIQKIIQQTAKKTWVKPETVERYFRLIAIQGFSDGMRAIIDIDGNQTTLSTNEICPACRGWILKSMNFSNQSAIFGKKTQDQTLYVNLQAN